MSQRPLSKLYPVALAALSRGPCECRRARLFPRRIRAPRAALDPAYTWLSRRRGLALSLWHSSRLSPSRVAPGFPTGRHVVTEDPLEAGAGRPPEGLLGAVISQGSFSVLVSLYCFRRAMGLSLQDPRALLSPPTPAVGVGPSSLGWWSLPRPGSTLPPPPMPPATAPRA